MKTSLSFASAALALALWGCASAPPTFSSDALPVAVTVPAGHRVSWEAVGIGEIADACKATAASATAAAGFEWVFVGPRARLVDRRGQDAGSHSGPPAMWVAPDSSRITGSRAAPAPAAPGNIPLQLVKANPSTGSLAGTAYIQRVWPPRAVSRPPCLATVAPKANSATWPARPTASSTERAEAVAAGSDRAALSVRAP